MTNGGVAQLGEHLPCKQGVKSSNLSVSTQDYFLFYSSIAQLVEHSAVNRVVVGSSPTWGAQVGYLIQPVPGSVVKRLRHRPFTAVTRVRFPSESLICRCGSIGRAADL